MSIFTSKPETIIKPETPIPSSTDKPSSSSEFSKMSNKATGFASAAPSSNSSETPPRSPAQSKPAWPNQSNQWTANNSSGPGRYQATQNYPTLTSQQQGPYALDRGDGTVSRLIPADELPFDIVGVPRREAPGSFSVVSGQPPHGPPYQVVRMDRDRVASPQADLSLSKVDYRSPHSARAGPYDAVGISYNPPAPPVLALPLYPTEALQEAIDDIVSRPRLHKGAPVTRRQKIYCDKWLQTGNCGFQQVGCKFKHEMPMDRATQLSVGLNGLPDWWTKALNVSLRPLAQVTRSVASGRPGDKSWRNEAEMSGLKAGTGIRQQALMPSHKRVPYHLQGSSETFADKLNSRLGGISLGAPNHRTINAGFSEMSEPLGAEPRGDFGVIGDRPSTLSNNFQSPSRSFGSTSGVTNYYSLLGEFADKRLDAAAYHLDDDGQSDYSGGITPF